MPRRKARARTAAARAVRLGSASLRSADLAAVATPAVEGPDVERIRAEEEEVLDGDRRRLLQLRLESLATHAGVVEESAATTADVSSLVLMQSCSSCDEPNSFKEEYAVDLDGKATRFLPSRVKLVYNSLVIGGGFAGLQPTLVNLGMKALHKKTFVAYCNFIYRQVDLMWERHLPHLTKTMEGILAASGVHRTDDGFLEVAVSYDGSWMTGGHRSHVGVGFVMDVEHGFVLDFEVLSNFCQKCCKQEKALSTSDFSQWKTTHTNCEKNFDGKGGAMEVEAALRMWQRSEGLGFRYSTFIGDRDCAIYNAICALNDGAGPYTTPVVKEECLNHVSQRIGTRIKRANLRRTKFAATVTSLEHNLGFVNSNLLFRLGLITQRVIETQKRLRLTPMDPPQAKKRRVQSPDEPSTSCQPGGL